MYSPRHFVTLESPLCHCATLGILLCHFVTLGSPLCHCVTLGILLCHFVTLGSPLCHLHNKAQCSLSSCVLHVMSPEHTVFYNLSLGSVCKTPCVYHVNKTQSIYYVSLCTEHCVHYILCPWLLSAVSCQLNTQPNIGCHADLADTPLFSQLHLYTVTVLQ